MKDQNTWILVADGNKALILETTQATKHTPWAVVETLQQGSGHTGHQHDDSSSQSPGDAQFARQLVGALTAGFDAHRYKRLVLAAPPHFLGMLRQDLSAGVEGCVVGAVDKHYTQLRQPELQERLDELV